MPPGIVWEVVQTGIHNLSGETITAQIVRNRGETDIKLGPWVYIANNDAYWWNATYFANEFELIGADVYGNALNGRFILFYEYWICHTDTRPIATGFRQPVPEP